MHRLLVGALTLLAVFVAAPSSAVVILAPGSTWEYTFSSSDVTGPNADWNTETNATDEVGDPTWATGAAPFGNCSPAPGDCLGFTTDFDYNTFWAADGADADDLWVRTTFDATGFIPGSIAWDLGVDNGYTLYLNGVFIAGANAEGYTFRWEYGGAFGAALLPGTNVLAVALEDHGGLTAFDMQVSGEPVPEPGTLLLLGSGLAGVALRRRRRG